MTLISRHVSFIAVIAAVGALTSSAMAQEPGAESPAAEAKADHGIPPFTPADVHFMQGMIHHHAQAVVMARWAESHGARPSVVTLCKRIDVSQRDEILTMQTWLHDRHLDAANPDFHYPDTGMAGMPGMGSSSPLMPGMLTPEQMAALDKARGSAWDRLFLLDMIQHHLGALAMVDQLFDSQGAAQDDKIFKFASDVSADQTAEIGRMRAMLEVTPTSSGQ
jgi:uncharacterized protein (DUF305 family)